MHPDLLQVSKTRNRWEDTLRRGSRFCCRLTDHQREDLNHAREKSARQTESDTVKTPSGSCGIHAGKSPAFEEPQQLPRNSIKHNFTSNFNVIQNGASSLSLGSRSMQEYSSIVVSVCMCGIFRSTGRYHAERDRNATTTHPKPQTINPNTHKAPH